MFDFNTLVNAHPGVGIRYTEQPELFSWIIDTLRRITPLLQAEHGRQQRLLQQQILRLATPLHGGPTASVWETYVMNDTPMVSVFRHEWLNPAADLTDVEITFTGDVLYLSNSRSRGLIASLHSGDYTVLDQLFWSDLSGAQLASLVRWCIIGILPGTAYEMLDACSARTHDV